MRAFIAAAAVAVLLAGAAQATPQLSVSGPWSRPATAGSNGVGYLAIANTGKAPETLVAAESPLARSVQMHSSSMKGGVMSMARETQLAIPAGGRVAFAPGGHHLMLIGLTRTVKAGDAIPVTLTFASGVKLKTALAVGTGAAPAMAGMAH
jgi:copper(I)-binding protein